MKHRRIKVTAERLIAAIVASWLVVLPFHAFVTVWASSAVGHYTLLRLWKELLLAIAVILAVVLVMRSAQLRRQLFGDWLWRLSAVYVFIMIAWGVVALMSHEVSAKALWYGELVNIRLFGILFVAWVAASGTTWLYRHWRRLVVLPAIGVMVIGLLQRFALPYDVMKHFGYNDQTISPYETIDHKVDYIRIRSTLRGANLLGAYMIIVLGVGVQHILGYTYRRLHYIAFALVVAMTLFVSGSRGAWIGAVVAGVVLLWLQMRASRTRRLYVAVFLVAGLVFGASLVLLRDNDFVQNTFFHTDEHSRSTVSSNDAHLNASLDALKQVATEPLGRGPGTAGPASYYNGDASPRIAENYFLQIGQETGWIGLSLVVALFTLLARALWRRRDNALAQSLLASLAGLTVMALLMHIWTDDTIAYLWFSLAGIALAQPITRPTRGTQTT